MTLKEMKAMATRMEIPFQKNATMTKMTELLGDLIGESEESQESKEASEQKVEEATEKGKTYVGKHPITKEPVYL